MLPSASREFRQRELRLAAGAVLAARRIWLRVGDDFDASWTTVGPRLVTLTIAAQVAAARLADPYLSAVLAETDQPNAPVAAVRPAAFTGTAADGRPLPGFLFGAVIAAKRARRDASTVDALAVGGRWLDMATETIVADTARSAVTTGITIRPDIDGYVRSTGGQACTRCLVLAGKFYPYSAGFARHPRCHCMHTPVSRARAHDFTETVAVHAADLSSLDVAARSTAGRRMPEQIVAAATDRTQAIALLHAAGFVT